ncbi:MAG: type VI secretion system ATPase TssH, partial [Duodenibacillus sp.]|nr:type VI secretion system ATPase TssH [Duodenibacillus sp.]
NALGAEAIRAIAGMQLARLARRMAAQDVTLEASDAALDKIAAAGFDPLYGARPLKRAVQDLVETPVAKLLLNGECGPKDTVRIEPGEEPGKLEFRVEKAA